MRNVIGKSWHGVRVSGGAEDCDGVAAIGGIRHPPFSHKWLHVMRLLHLTTIGRKPESGVRHPQIVKIRFK